MRYLEQSAAAAAVCGPLDRAQKAVCALLSQAECALLL